MEELTCIVCRARFVPIDVRQRCCTSDCAVRAGRDWEYTYVIEALDEMHKKAWAIQIGKTYD